MRNKFNIGVILNKRPLRLIAICVSILFITPIILNSPSFAESGSDAHKPPERIIKRKPAEKKSTTAHTETVKTPDAIESSHSFPPASEKPPDPEIVEAVVILDSSRSMQKTDPKRIRDQGAKLFLQFLEPEDKVAIVEFSDTANVLMDLKPMKGLSTEDINGILEGIKNEGNFTNFIPPLETALELLLSSEDKNSSKVIVLLTDGQMDPGPAPEIKNEFVEKLIKEKIPEIHKRRIKVFTIGLSELADKDLLSEIAKKTEGHSEYAKDVNSIHKVFSDLFLSIKKPQVLELESGGFSIDGNTGEATFFINRQSEADSITVIDPTGKDYINKDFPARWKWFRGDLFDVVTIPSPLPGRWGIMGGAGDLSGFAKLLSDLKLEYSFPAQSYSIGDSAVVKVRLTESGKIVDDPNFAGLIFYTYKIVNSKTGQLYLQGQLADKGDRGDDTAGDGVFADVVTLNEEGDYKLFLIATAPTFTRQAHIPFSVTKGIISLEHIAKNEFTGAKEQYHVTLHSHAIALSKRKVVIDVKVKDEKFQVDLEKYKLEENVYEIPLDKLKPGENHVVAIVQGLDDSKHEVHSKSEEVLVQIESHQEEKTHEPEDVGHVEEKLEDSDIHEEHPETETPHEGEPTEVVESNLVFGLIGILISIASSFLLGKMFIQKSKTEGGTTVVVREEYEVPSSLKEQLEKIYAKVGTEVREFYPEEMVIFSSLVSGGDFAPQSLTHSGDGESHDDQRELSDLDSSKDKSAEEPNQEDEQEDQPEADSNDSELEEENVVDQEIEEVASEDSEINDEEEEA